MSQARAPRSPFGLPTGASNLPAVFWKNKYERARVLAAADQARSRGRVRAAVKGYLRVLEHEPEDHPVRAKVAPLLAALGKWEQAIRSFDQAAQGFLDKGFAPKAIAVWSVAAETFPERVAYWERIANEQVKRGRRQDAVGGLAAGTRAAPPREAPAARGALAPAGPGAGAGPRGSDARSRRPVAPRGHGRRGAPPARATARAHRTDPRAPAAGAAGAVPHPAIGARRSRLGAGALAPTCRWATGRARWSRTGCGSSNCSTRCRPR